ncbi:MAG: hypothetical protein ACFFDS_05805 [Candidatus Thorarchaeota archaeon]
MKLGERASKVRDYLIFFAFFTIVFGIVTGVADLYMAIIFGVLTIIFGSLFVLTLIFFIFFYIREKDQVIEKGAREDTEEKLLQKIDLEKVLEQTR